MTTIQVQDDRRVQEIEFMFDLKPRIASYHAMTILE
jgi:hypothetical protein